MVTGGRSKPGDELCANVRGLPDSPLRAYIRGCFVRPVGEGDGEADVFDAPFGLHQTILKFSLVLTSSDRPCHGQGPVVGIS